MDCRVETDITTIYEEVFDINNKTLTQYKITNITNAVHNIVIKYKKLENENEVLKKRIEIMETIQNNNYDCSTINNILICLGALFMVWMTFYLCQEDISKYHKF